MKIAFLGSRGIPNNYGGFEAFAEKISVLLVERGHQITVFNSSLHPYKNSNFKGVEIIKCFDAEDLIGTAGQFIYDLNCILECRKRDFDIIMQLGYTSSSIFNRLLPKGPKLITNMDGLEWKRSKYPALVKLFIKRAEIWAIKRSNYLVADNPAIQEYLNSTYGVKSTYIPYGAELFTTPTENALTEFGLTPFNYNLCIARMEPENNIEEIIKGHLEAEAKTTLAIVGGAHNSHGKFLSSKYASPQIKFLNSVYDVNKLNNLRWFSNLYFHGHSVGGTNPSLLEAMAAGTLICAHDNPFNHTVLGHEGFYFNDSKSITQVLNSKPEKQNFGHFIQLNNAKIMEHYNWKTITDQYEKLFTEACLKNE